jgi:hypothetical protein
LSCERKSPERPTGNEQRRPHGRRRKRRAAGQLRAVEEPEHAWKLHAREPGDLRGVWAGNGARPAGKGAKPYSPHARFGGVAPRHSTEEPPEQRESASGGGRGGKAAGQGERRPGCTHPTQSGSCVSHALAVVRLTGGRYHLRQEPYAGNLHVRICAGGGGRPPSLPRPVRMQLGLAASRNGSELGSFRWKGYIGPQINADETQITHLFSICVYPRSSAA